VNDLQRASNAILSLLAPVAMVSFLVAAGPAACGSAENGSGITLLGQTSQSTGQGGQPASATGQTTASDSIWMDMRGGFGRWEYYTIQIDRLATGGRVQVARKIWDVDKETKRSVNITAGDLDTLWTTLDKNSIMTLKDRPKGPEKITDLYTFQIRASHAGKTNQFTVFGPNPFDEQPQDALFNQARDALLDLADRVCPLTKDEESKISSMGW